MSGQVDAVKSLLALTHNSERQKFIKQLQEEVVDATAAARHASLLVSPQKQAHLPGTTASHGRLQKVLSEGHSSSIQHPFAKLTAIAAGSKVSNQQPGGSSAPNSAVPMQQSMGAIPSANSSPSHPRPSSRQSQQHREDRQPGKGSNHPGQEGGGSAPRTGLELLEVLLRKMPAATVAHYNDHIQVLRRLLLPLSLSNAAPLVRQLEEVLSAPLPAASEAFGPADPRTAGLLQRGVDSSTLASTNGNRKCKRPLTSQSPPNVRSDQPLLCLE